MVECLEVVTSRFSACIDIIKYMLYVMIYWYDEKVSSRTLPSGHARPPHQELHSTFPNSSLWLLMGI